MAQAESASTCSGAKFLVFSWLKGSKAVNFDKIYALLRINNARMPRKTTLLVFVKLGIDEDGLTISDWATGWLLRLRNAVPSWGSERRGEPSLLGHASDDDGAEHEKLLRNLFICVKNVATPASAIWEVRSWRPLF
jgi:hypothetical protein